MNWNTAGRLYYHTAQWRFIYLVVRHVREETTGEIELEDVIRISFPSNTGKAFMFHLEGTEVKFLSS